jgi:hypothetical protein
MATAYSYTREHDGYSLHQVILEVAVANSPAYYKMALITDVKKVLLQAP